MKAPPAKKILFFATIPLIWVLVFLALEGVLVLSGYGEDYALFDTFEPGMVVDNPEYVRRFYAAGNEAGASPRSNLLPEAKNPSTRRVFVVGGSTAQGFPYQRNHSFTGIAQASLRASGLDVDVVNLGNSAMSSYYLREVLSDVRRYDPDLVVIYAGHNEYYGTLTSFTGGTHLSRLVLLRLKKFRSVQLLENAIAGMRPARGETGGPTLMEERFAEAAFPMDSIRDRQVAELFIRNLAAGLRPLLAADVPVVIFEPVSNLVSMPPFRGGGVGPGADGAGVDGPAAIDLYRDELERLESGEWSRRRWESIKDRDEVPFRARSTLVEQLALYAAERAPLVSWVPTADELERRAGPDAFTEAYFIDHLHFNFEGQRLLAALLAEAIVDRLFFGDPRMRSALADYFQDGERVRQGVHLTAFWEFEAYNRIINLLSREPFVSMPVPKAIPTYPDEVRANPLFRNRDFVESLQRAPVTEYFSMALNRYRELGDREELIRNMNAYVHLYPGHYETHFALGMALLDDDARAYLEPAGSYFRRAYYLSGRSEEVSDAVRAALFERGLGSVWESFRLRFLE